MFSGCSSLTELDIKNFNTAKDPKVHNMFADCNKLSNEIKNKFPDKDE